MGKTVIGDLHLVPKSLDLGDHLFELIEQLNQDTIFLGDLLDTKEVIRGKCLNTLISYFKRSKLHHYVLVGNHDWFNLECEAHSLETLKLLPNVTVIDSPIVLNDLVFFPYIHNKDVLLRWIKEFEAPNRTLFAHLEVSNFDYGNGHICTSGLSLSDLKGFKRVISGHFHKFQEMGNLTFLGTPHSHSFGESNQTKYIGLFDETRDLLEKIETPFPKHITTEIDCDHLIELPVLSQKDIHRVILVGAQANIHEFPKEKYPTNIKWISRPNDYVENTVSIEETLSNEAQFRSWASERLDPETVQLGLQILQSCR